MKRKTFLILMIIALLSSAVAIGIYKYSMGKIIEAYTYKELEQYGYSAADVAEIRVDHSVIRELLGYNGWRISVEFDRKAGTYFWFTYRDKKIIFQGVSADQLLDKEKTIEYSEKFKNGTLLK